jgi:carboxylate-amine ligase
MSKSPPRHRLFTRFGVELEYAIVDARTLEVRPIADELFRLETGAIVDDVDRGPIGWSNELALHVVELKTAAPARALDGLAPVFQREVRHLNRQLARLGARLLPAAMHPWMNPARESRLWPHGNREIYAAFDQLFGCAGHGWTNLQSVHVNLPFADDAEFARLHTAIRLVLPLLPALAAASPYRDGVAAAELDGRLAVYAGNCAKIPCVTAGVVPDVYRTEADYRRGVFDPIQRALARYRGTAVLEPEWTNARGAIARFDRGSIEIRVLDLQECPAADLAIVQAVAAIVRAFTQEKLAPLAAQERPATAELRRVYAAAVRGGDRAPVRSSAYLRALGWSRPSTPAPSAAEVWTDLLSRAGTAGQPWRKHVDFILQEGCLARRLVRAVGEKPTRPRLREVYTRLADTLERGEAFRPD